jgi:hypothetical protein
MAVVADVIMAGLESAKPAASSSNDGYLYFATDTGGGTLYRSNGSSWVQVALGVTEGATPDAHASSHQNGGGDEISVTGLSGLLADAQTPDTHAGEHLPSGGDPLTTAAASGLGNANAEGTAESFARSDHAHKRDVRVAKAGSDVGTRNRLNFIEGANVTLTIADDSGSDEVDITIAAAGSTTGEIFLTAAGGWPSTTSGCADNAKTEHTTNDVDLWSLDFDPDADEYAQWSVWMPDAWDASTITFKAMWTAASSTGDVVWGLQGRAYADDDAIDQAWGTAQTVTDTLLATGDIHYTAESSAITLAGTPAAGQLVQFRVYRDADAGGDTLAADAKLLGIKIYYQKS